MRPAIYLVFALIVALGPFFASVAQNSQPAIQQDPYTGKQGEASRLTVGTPGYTGALAISYPLFSVAVPGFGLDFTMNYSYAGPKVGTTDSDFGLGWSLGGNWTVSREVKGLPDDDSLGVLNYDAVSSHVPNHPTYERNDHKDLPSQTITSHFRKDLNDIPNGESTWTWAEDTISFDPVKIRRYRVLQPLNLLYNRVLDCNYDLQFDIYTISTSSGSFRFSLYNSNNKVKVNKLEPNPYYIQVVIDENSTTKVRKIIGFKISLLNELSVMLDQVIYKSGRTVITWGLSKVERNDNNQVLISCSYQSINSHALQSKYIVNGIKYIAPTQPIVNEQVALGNPINVTRSFLRSITTANSIVTFTPTARPDRIVPCYFENAYSKITQLNLVTGFQENYFFKYKVREIAFKDSLIHYLDVPSGIRDTTVIQKKTMVPTYLESISVSVAGTEQKALYKFDYNDVPDLYNLSTSCDKFGFQNGVSPVIMPYRYDRLRWTTIVKSIPTYGYFVNFNTTNMPNKEPVFSHTGLGFLREIDDIQLNIKKRINIEPNQVWYNNMNTIVGGVRLSSVEESIGDQLRTTQTYAYTRPDDPSKSSGIYYGILDNNNFSSFTRRKNDLLVQHQFPFFLSELIDNNGQPFAYQNIEVINNLPIRSRTVIKYNVNPLRIGNADYSFLLMIAYRPVNVPVYRTYCQSKNIYLGLDINSYLNGTVQSVESFDRNDVLLSKQESEYLVEPYLTPNSFKLAQLFSEDGGESNHYVFSKYEEVPVFVKATSVVSSVYNSNGILIKATTTNNVYDQNVITKLRYTEVTEVNRVLRTNYTYLSDLSNWYNQSDFYNNLFDFDPVVETRTILNNTYTLGHTVDRFHVRIITSTGFDLPYSNGTSFNYILESKRNYTLNRRFNQILPIITNTYADLITTAPGSDYTPAAEVEEINAVNLPTKINKNIGGAYDQITYDTKSTVVSSVSTSTSGLAYFNTYDQYTVTPTSGNDNLDFSNTNSILSNIAFGHQGKSLLFSSQYSAAYTIELTQEQRQNISAIEASMYAKCMSPTDQENLTLVMFLHRGDGANGSIPVPTSHFDFSITGQDWSALKGRMTLKRETYKAVLNDNQPLYLTVYVTRQNPASTTQCLIDEFFVHDLSSTFSSPSKTKVETGIIRVTEDVPSREFAQTETKVGEKTIIRDHKRRILSKTFFIGQ